MIDSIVAKIPIVTNIITILIIQEVIGLIDDIPGMMPGTEMKVTMVATIMTAAESIVEMAMIAGEDPGLVVNLFNYPPISLKVFQICPSYQSYSRVNQSQFPKTRM